MNILKLLAQKVVVIVSSFLITTTTTNLPFLNKKTPLSSKNNFQSTSILKINNNTNNKQVNPVINDVKEIKKQPNNINKKKQSVPTTFNSNNFSKPNPKSKPIPTSLPTPTPTPTPVPTPTSTTSSSDRTPLLIFSTNTCPVNKVFSISPSHDVKFSYHMSGFNKLNIVMESTSIRYNFNVSGSQGVLATMPHGKTYKFTVTSKDCNTSKDFKFEIYQQNLN